MALKNKKIWAVEGGSDCLFAVEVTYRLATSPTQSINGFIRAGNTFVCTICQVARIVISLKVKQSVTIMYYYW